MDARAGWVAGASSAVSGPTHIQAASIFEAAEVFADIDLRASASGSMLLNLGADLVSALVSDLCLLLAAGAQDDLILIPREFDNGGLKSSQIDTGGDGESVTFTQAAPAFVWVIVHNLGRRPVVQVFDSANDEILVDVKHIDTSTLNIIFAVATSGTAYIG